VLDGNEKQRTFNKEHIIMIVYAAENLDITGMGGGVAAGNELVAICAAGYPVTVITRTRMPWPATVGGVRVPEPEWIEWGAVSVPQPPELSRAYLRAQWQLIQQTRRIRALAPKLLIVQGVRSHRHLEQYRSWEGVPRWMTIQGSPDQFSGVYHDGENRLPRACREMACYSGLVQVSKQLAQKWAQQEGLADIPMRVIPNTLNEDALQPVLATSKSDCRAQLGIPPGQLVIVCTASVQYRKGQDLLLDCLENLVTAEPSLHLYLVGPVIMGWGGREFMNRLDKHPVKAHVHMVGAQPPETAWHYTRAADLFVLPSREEAMPLSILEAMFLETPVVASDVDGIPDQVEDGKSGLLFSHAGQEMMGEQILRMMTDAAFRSRCAAVGQDRFKHHFERKHYLDKWAMLVEEIVA
jgi:glycosyltransferase involved in cell wall biosynthesis